MWTVRPADTLRWSSPEEAVLRHSRLRVIAGVQLPEYGPPPPDQLVEEVRKAAQHEVDEVLAGWADTADGLPVSVEARIGRPGEVLCDSADLLDVGHRGRGSVASGLLGSVGLHPTAR